MKQSPARSSARLIFTGCLLVIFFSPPGCVARYDMDSNTTGHPSNTTAPLGDPKSHDYTIQTDAQGAPGDHQMPDIGLIAQGYPLDLQGAGQKREIRTWVAPDVRARTTIGFPWQPNRRHAMKFRASNQHGAALLRGKVGPQGEQEPAARTIQLTDPAPNTSGNSRPLRQRPRRGVVSGQSLGNRQ